MENPPRRRWRMIRRIAICIVLSPLLAWLTFRAAVAFWPYPHDVERLPTPGAWVEDRGGIPLAAFVSPDDQWRLPLSEDQISPHLLNAIVAVEDCRFEEHRGVDWKAIAAACWDDLSSLRLKRGASTITMQLHRLRDPAPRSFFWKFEQAVRATQIEKRTDKRAILAEYLNRAPFGGNLTGAGAASWRYFSRPCRELSLGQAALLAGLPQNPARLRPDRYPDRAKTRRDHVLRRMLACGLVTRPQFDEAMAEPVEAAWHPLPQMASRRTLAEGSLPTLIELARSANGPVIRTTIDAAIQHQAASAARQQIDALSPSGVTAVAVVVLDTETAECLASVSLTTERGNLDLTRRRRSTGSALKPFIYAAAFEAGICTPETILRDSPSAWPGYVPDNYDHGFRGSITAAQALAESRNIPALHLLSRVGVEEASSLMGTMGLRGLSRSPQRYGLSLAIGGAEASPREVADAYATLARGGQYVPSTLLDAGAGDAPAEPRAYLSRDRKGAIREGDAPALPTALSVNACAATLRAISGQQRTAAICPEAAALRIAWKTGTSSGNRDAWCAAVTPRRTVVVWLGNASGKGSHCLVGAEAAAPLALRLIASLDRNIAPWDDTAPADAPAPAIARRAAYPRLTLLSPVDGTEVVYNPDVPAARQQLLLRAIVSTEAGGSNVDRPTIWWFVDGQPAGSGPEDQQLWWGLTPGSHEVRAVDADGRSARAKIRVR